MKDGYISMTAIMPLPRWVEIKRHIAGKPISIGAWVAKAVIALHEKETREEAARDGGNNG